MSKSLTEKINIFLTVDLQTINGYFNAHDPSPLYKKQISQKFENYILTAVESAKRYSAIFYKLNCPGIINRQYAEPLMYAVKRHFSIKREIRKDEFIKFKRRNFAQLAISGVIVIICQWFLPLIISEHVVGGIYNGLKNCLDVFSWVILWKPIYELLFAWNPFLKDILLLDKLATSEVIILESKKTNERETFKSPVKDWVEISDEITYESLVSN
ncbi:MAG TPA: hypothetical protein VHB70_10150 [Parafilimonas sp.]|nr:hypothetical protein [Parafilimonas sp.]